MGHVADRLRLSGADLKLPVHYLWYNILRHLGWEIFEDVEDPERFAPAFYVAPQSGPRVPVVCEVYAYVPGDTSDKLQREAERFIERHYPDGALLLFNAVPYREVDGKPYSFGGRLFRARQWRDFAINEHMSSFDAVLEQVASGFEFGQDLPRWADEQARLAAAATLMSYEVDTPEAAKLVSLKTGDWHMLIA